MSTIDPTLHAPAPAHVSSNAVFGRVMALVALTADADHINPVAE